MTDPAPGQSGEIAFGPFRLRPAEQILLEGERPVRLGSRAREILAALLERAGTVISKEDLIARVWPDTTVEEGNLKVHVAGLRRALGDGRPGRRYVVNIPGRGYSFVGTILAPGARDTAPIAAAEAAPPSSETRPKIFGRSETVESLIEQVTRHRFVTLVGPGGIGKTTVAVAAGDRLGAALKDGVHFVDLSPIADRALVPSALASVLGLPVRSDQSGQNIVSFLKDKQALVILDNCEHVIEAAAVLAEAVLRGARRTLILATSREPLRATGERVHRLAPLEAPPASADLTAAEALRYPAVQLFVERAASSLEGFRLKDSEAAVVADTCRKLDGLALAIELTASRIDAFGVAGLASLLADRFRLLRGRRTAVARHQTLGATLDWSYVLLSGPERVVLRRLGVFAGAFTMDAAALVLADDDLSESQVIDSVADLVAKSFVTAAVEEAVARYRLLDTTRAYARAKLREHAEADALARRHAAHCVAQLGEADAEWGRRPAAEWIVDHRPWIDDVRLALDWAFSAAGDAGIAVALTIGTLPLWFQSSLIDECQKRVERALAIPSEDAGSRMRLYAALGWSLMQTRGSGSDTRDAWSRVLTLAERLGDIDYQLRALWGLWAGMLNRCELRPALELAQRFYDLAKHAADPTDLQVGDRMIGYILHLLGDQSGGRRHIERMLSGYVTPVIGAQVIRFVFDQRVTARSFLARILWLQGHPDRAMRLVDEIVADAVEGRDPLSICQALVQAACPVAIFVGDLHKLDTYTGMLLDHADRNALGFFARWGHGFKSVWLIRRGNIRDGLTCLREALAELKTIEYGVYYITLLGELAEALGASGETESGLLAIDDALDRAHSNEEFWYIAELFRIKGELLARQGTQLALAETMFGTSLDWARQHGTPSWALRTATDLARLLHRTGRAEAGRQLVGSILATFSEGFGTHDLILADAVMTAPD